MTVAALTAKLAHVAQQIELHRTALWLLEDERLQLQQQLRALEFRPSDAKAALSPSETS